MFVYGLLLELNEPREFMCGVFYCPRFGLVSKLRETMEVYNMLAAETPKPRRCAIPSSKEFTAGADRYGGGDRVRVNTGRELGRAHAAAAGARNADVREIYAGARGGAVAAKPKRRRARARRQTRARALNAQLNSVEGVASGVDLAPAGSLIKPTPEDKTIVEREDIHAAASRDSGTTKAQATRKFAASALDTRSFRRASVEAVRECASNRRWC
ncbi:hypothetical protein B0H17DRAFT_1125270 [Mycena rosella]|uniref:Uncharacterized protein n=1 Tax=Mycena rosella TaxID=1033263 RepID=A0AAD7GXG6_MYCRO|nr:hypothetical protein B0H17DRAFT_1125270 [Mycena rosella]